MRIDRQTFWFLDLVIELRENLAVLRSSNIEEIINRPTHGLGERELVEALTALCQAGLIEVANEHGVRACSPHEVERAFAESSCKPRHYSGFWYGLTPAGGAAWESVTRPDWSLYSTYGAGQEDICIEAASHERALEEFAWASKDPTHVPIMSSYQETRLQPWEATYWKTLSEGFRIQYAWAKGRNTTAWLLSKPFSRRWYEEPKLDGLNG
ncbi:hypothetical protein HPC49_06835 [Pyxidicoccus fallax]|uniref:Uncharacterized protein n=1 Tax=Pyxidicoccus fallax TaxID=394095 RepID=A0A848LI79_9BACT|nr:hypothetical protein [Pyxidicoccus fallax]NMO17420.1 hypothetical protein [Pyxidicoccus fallax]NPC77969.1 hypothetical protein [Pyxidicoccus fallax]